MSNGFNAGNDGFGIGSGGSGDGSFESILKLSDATAGEGLSAFDPVRVVAGEYFSSESALTSTEASCVGIALAAVLTGQPFQLVKSGLVVGAIAGATPGQRFYVGAAGGLTSVVPTTVGDFVVEVGRAVSATDLWVDVQSPAEIPAPVITGDSRTINFGPINDGFSEEILRDIGRVGSEIVGHYFILDDTYYVWYRHDGIGFDPQIAAVELVGMTGIRVDLPAGNVADTAVATATAAAIDGVGSYTAIAVGVAVTIGECTTVSSGDTDWESAAEAGVLGTPDNRLLGFNSFQSATLRACELDVSSRSVPFILTGCRLAIGDTHDGQLVMAIYQGGVTGDFETASLLGYLGSTTGSDIETWGYIGSQDGVLVNPASGVVWVAWAHDVGDFEMPFTASGQSNAVGSDFVITGGDASFPVSGGAAFSTSAGFPATLGAMGAGEAGIPSFLLSFVDVGWHSNMVPAARIGTREQDASLFTGTSGAPLLVGNSFATPDNLGMEVRTAGINYATHSSGSDYRLALATGGTADNDFNAAVWQDIGQTSGTATGWNDIVAPSGVSIAGSSRIFITIEFDGVGGSELAFDADGPGAYGDPNNNPAAYYNGNTSESEVDDGSLGGTPSTNVDFDPSTPITGAQTFDGTIYNNDNNVGVRMVYHVPGFEIVPVA